MVLTAFLLTLLAIIICSVGIGYTFRLLGLNARQTLLWLGVLEVPPPAVSRRAAERARRAAASPRTNGALPATS